jgi:hypothetical protein
MKTVMKPIIKLNNWEIDIPIENEFAKDIRIGDILCVYDFDTEKYPDWVLEYIGDDFDDEPFDKFPVDTDYRLNNKYFKLEVTGREFRDDILIIWVDIWSIVDIEFK